MDTYQPIYDAVRSRIRNGDIGQAVENALMMSDIGHGVAMAANAVAESHSEHSRPSAVMRPSLFLDGNMYCALYGEDLMDGCAGFGDTPEAAMADFDKNWVHAKAPTRVGAEG